MPAINQSKPSEQNTQIKSYDIELKTNFRTLLRARTRARQCRV